MLGPEFDVATFLDHLVYEWLKDNYYPKLLFTTQDQALIRQAMFSGLALPATCLSRTSSPEIDPERYGKSVMKRTMLYQGEPVQVQLIDYTIKYSLFSAGYLLSDVNRAHQIVTYLDNERYFDFDLSDVIPPSFHTKVEFQKTGQDFRTDMSDDTAQRKTSVSVDWRLKVTIPCIESAAYIDLVNLYINNHHVASIGGL